MRPSTASGPFTIFAPTNDAFAKIPTATLNSVMADPTGALTKILTYHVISGKSLNADQLAEAGTETTVEGGTVKIAKSGDTIEVNGTVRRRLRQRQGRQRHRADHRHGPDAPVLTPSNPPPIGTLPPVGPGGPALRAPGHRRVRGRPVSAGVGRWRPAGPVGQRPRSSAARSASRTFTRPPVRRRAPA